MKVSVNNNAAQGVSVKLLNWIFDQIELSLDSYEPLRSVEIWHVK